jgi:hypothetical protein
MVGFWGGRESVGFVMSKVLYGTDRLAPVLDSRGTGIYLLTKPKPSPPFVYMGLGVSTKKRGFYDTFFQVTTRLHPPLQKTQAKSEL